MKTTKQNHVKKLWKKAAALLCAFCLLSTGCISANAQSTKKIPSGVKTVALQVSEYTSTQLANNRSKTDAALSTQEKYDAVAVLAYKTLPSDKTNEKNLKNLYISCFGPRKKYNFSKSNFLEWNAQEKRFVYTGGDWGLSHPKNKVTKVTYDSKKKVYTVTVLNLLNLDGTSKYDKIGTSKILLKQNKEKKYVTIGMTYKTAK